MYIITGTSTGIGNALVHALLESNETVIGIGRKQTIFHEKYTHFTHDFLTSSFDCTHLLPLLKDVQSLTFIHNAGILGSIQPFQESSVQSFEEVFQVNLIAGVSIVHQLLNGFAKDRPLKIVFISSGAGKRPIASWSAYCASKAAVELFCETLALEMQVQQRTNIRCFAISPGVVDTPMQSQIRSTAITDFPDVTKFHEYKANKELANPKLIAQKILYVLNNNFNAVSISLRNIELDSDKP